jgi:hypothetical protein
MIARIDYIFSYWILLWYILYITGLFTSYSPKFGLILGIIENLILLIYISLYGASLSTILKFIVIIIVMKIIPYYTIQKDKIMIKDILFTVFIFLVYMIWIYLNNVQIIQVYNKINSSLVKNKGDTPGMKVINYVIQLIHLQKR